MAKKQIIDIDSEFDGVEFDEESINRITGASKAVSAREANGWHEKNQARRQDPEYDRRVSKAISKTYSTPEGRQKQSAKAHAQTDETKRKIRNANLGKNRRGAAWIASMAEKKKGNTARCRPIVTPVGAFISKKTAAEFYIDNKHTTRKTVPSVICWIDILVKQIDSGFYFISKEEYTMLTGEQV